MTFGLQLRFESPVKLFFFCAGLIGVLAGCNNTYVKVDAVARAGAEKSIAYQIRTTNPQLMWTAFATKRPSGT